MKNNTYLFKGAAFLGKCCGGYAAIKCMVIVSIFLIGFTGCQPPPSQEPASKTIEDEASLDPTAAQTPLPPPTETSLPTETTVPTETASPSKTPEPTRTSTPTQTALPEGVERIEVVTSNGDNLVGYLYRPTDMAERNLAVVLAPGYWQPHTDWENFVAVLVEKGFATLAFDPHGVGESSGNLSSAIDSLGYGFDVDAIAITNFVKSLGFEKIVCIGASMGGIGCLGAAVAPETNIDGLVILSSAHKFAGRKYVSEQKLSGLTIPKIFMTAEEDHLLIQDPEYLDNFTLMTEISGEPKSTYQFPGSSHGTNLLYDENFGAQVQDILLDFVMGLSE